MTAQSKIEKLLSELYKKKDSQSKLGYDLDEYERGVFETLSWIIDETPKPEIE